MSSPHRRAFKSFAQRSPSRQAALIDASFASPYGDVLDTDEDLISNARATRSLMGSALSIHNASADAAELESVMSRYDVDPAAVLDRLRQASVIIPSGRSDTQSTVSTSWHEPTIHESMVESHPVGLRRAQRTVYDPLDADETPPTLSYGRALSRSTSASPRYRITRPEHGSVEPDYDTMASPAWLSPKKAVTTAHLALHALPPKNQTVVSPPQPSPRLEPIIVAPQVPPEVEVLVEEEQVQTMAQTLTETLAAVQSDDDDLMNLDLETPEEKSAKLLEAQRLLHEKAFDGIRWRAGAASAPPEPPASASRPSSPLGAEPEIPIEVDGKKAKKSKKDKDGASPEAESPKKEKKSKKEVAFVPPVPQVAPLSPEESRIRAETTAYNPTAYQELIYEQYLQAADTQPNAGATQAKPLLKAVKHDPINTGAFYDPFHSLRWWELGAEPAEVIRRTGCSSAGPHPESGVPMFTDRFGNFTFGPYALHPMRQWMADYLADKVPKDDPVLAKIDTMLLKNITNVWDIEKQLVKKYGVPSSFATAPPSLKYIVDYPAESGEKFAPFTAAISADMQRKEKDSQKEKGKKKNEDDDDDEDTEKKSKEGKKDKKDKKDKGDKEKSDKKDDKTAGKDDKKDDKKDKKDKTDKKEKNTEKSAEKSGKEDKKEKKDKDAKKDKDDKKDKKDKKDKDDKKDKKDDKKDKKDKNGEKTAEKTDKKAKEEKKDKKDKSEGSPKKK